MSMLAYRALWLLKQSSWYGGIPYADCSMAAHVVDQSTIKDIYGHTDIVQWCHHNGEDEDDDEEVQQQIYMKYVL